MHQLLTTPVASLTQGLYILSPTISHRTLSSLRPQQHQKHQAKIHIGQVLRDSRVVQLHHTFTPLLTSPTLRGWRRAEFQSRQVDLTTHAKVRDPLLLGWMKTERRELDARIQTVEGHSRISKRTCSPISQRDLKSARSPIVRITTRVLPASTTRTAIP